MGTNGRRVFCFDKLSWSRPSQVWVWLATYGQPAEESAELEGRWEAMLERLFAKDGATAGTGGA